MRKKNFYVFFIGMDKINNVNFTGLRNIGSCEFQRQPNTISKSLSLVLSNDSNGKDLAEFKSVIAKVTPDLEKFRNNISSEIVNVECKSSGWHFTDALYLNGEEVKVNDKNLPIFTYIAKVTKKITGMPDNNFIVNEDYKDFIADESLIYGIRLTDSIPEDVSRLNLFNQFFQKDKVKTGAKQINDFIQNIMNKYFEVV